ncbi:phosphodiester glycosidase family protein [uncultured Bacteroides sp.]|uniref:phosphodiester glycosidase family protein n=1 Tax=uncultured Bacteroides sp. TaxID=162156 RepID=UPI002AAA66EF|nr:phosphodiester glycosidase family protein [uncultured Bacteroides sp.]
MKKQFLIFFIVFVIIMLVSTVSSCSKENGGNTPAWEWDDPETDTSNPDSAIISQGWMLQKSFGDLPSYIRAYKSPATLQGKSTIAYIVVADMSKGAVFSVLGEAKGYKTLSEFYNVDKAPIVMNGGYFWDGSSLSMLCREGKVFSLNNQIEYRSNATMLYYPTRGAFGLMDDGSYKVNWIYTNKNVTYAYPSPAKNKSGTSPLQMPSASFPEGATVWKAKTAIGAGPVLIKDGKYVNSYTEELFDSDSGIGPESNNPRTAVGITKSGILIFFVCEGRNMTQGVLGITLNEETKILQSLGCAEALNLDGGGSSCLLINGKETIKPSDGKQRSVVTAVSLK